MRYVVECPILKHQEVAPGHFRLSVSAPQVAREAIAGQFAMVLTCEGYYPFLRRPLSFERIFPGGVAFLYKIEGEGTRLLSRFSVGQMLSIQGPLGNGFHIETGKARQILVAGGIGVAPFPALAEAIILATGKPPEIVIAARNADLIMGERDFVQMGCTVHLATDDGSAGKKAFAHQVLETLNPAPENTCLYACGPMPMMKAVSEFALARSIPCQVSLEAQMACGDGACLGCVVETNREREGERMMRVCADGPVFHADIIDWPQHNMEDDR